jgi:hypothetical protein
MFFVCIFFYYIVFLVFITLYITDGYYNNIIMITTTNIPILSDLRHVIGKSTIMKAVLTIYIK